MDCNSQIHDELKNMGESKCPFCEQLIEEVNKVVETCCDEQELENINCINTCVNCGLVHGDVYIVGYIDFYDNMHKIRLKSVYNRKYHIDNVMNSISFENNIKLTNHERNKIYKVFNEINSIIHEVNDGRKRMICIKFIMKQLFRMLGIPHEDIHETKSKKTLRYYKRYWKNVQLLIGDKVQSIINM